MTVYVDGLVDYGPGKGLWCHMMTDQDSLDELHIMADKIGLRREWFQDHPLHPHYDLRPGKRALAIRRGAVLVTATELASRCSRLFKSDRASE